MKTFIFITPTGKFARSYYHGGGFAVIKEDNQFEEVNSVNDATVFSASSVSKELRKLATKLHYLEVPAYITRIVTLGEKPSE